MKRLTLLAALIALTALAVVPSAQAAFGIKAFDLTFTNANGSTASQAGSHPFAITNKLEFNTVTHPKYGVIPEEAAKDIKVRLPEGLVGKPSAVPRCSGPDFIHFNQETKIPACSNSTAVGVVSAKVFYRPGEPPQFLSAPVYNLAPPPGVVQKFGFIAFGVPIAIEFTLNSSPPYNVVASLHDIAQPLPVFGSVLTIWGNPADPAHDSQRGGCIRAAPNPSEGIHTTGKSCPTNIAEAPIVTLPRACTGPLVTSYEADSWQRPGEWTLPGIAVTHDDSIPPTPTGMTGCSKLGFGPTITSTPTSKAAESPTGLDFSLDVNDEGLTSSSGLANSDIKRAVVTLPEGMSANPSIAEGLGVCSEEDLEAETAGSAPGAGCPNASKIGSVEVETPLLEESVNGSLFIAKPYDNPFDSLLALYMVIKNPNLGIVVKQPLKVEPNPVTGQLTTVADNLPQLPFSHFKLRFHQGARSPLASPSTCGTYNTKAVLTPWSGGAPITTTSAFQVVTGPNGGPCPSAIPPFHPTLLAGTLNNSAGKYSPFNLRLSRNDGEQELTRFSLKLPPGVTGKLAGIPFCADSAIEVAKSRTATEELATPSCPQASQLGRTLAGAGVGPSLAYAPGKVYLAGPYRGATLSIVAITAAKVGPFDVGTVVIREALRINPETAEVFADATGSDQIPHIIDGIPVHAREIRVYVDRPEFVLNPTNCTRSSTASPVQGAGRDFGSTADDQLFTATSPFQAADCARLGFAPKLALSLKGGTKRGDNPKFKALLTYPKGSYANIAAAQVTLPHSEFLDQSHIKTICTRVQFNEGKVPGEKCPAGSVYGHAKAITPLLAEPIEGPVFLRSSSHNLPDLVVALHSERINIDLVGRIDSVKGGRIRNTFEGVPDAPVTSFVLEMQGGKKGLLVNSTDICAKPHKAIADFTGQNGKKRIFQPVLKAQCGKAHKKSSREKHRRSRLTQ
jgi:hypothetical protein